jgi:hypothetical protein
MSIQSLEAGDPLAPHRVSASERAMVIAAERACQEFLAFRDHDGALVLRETPASDETHTVGRGPETDLSIEWDAEVSRVHALLQNVGGELAVVDDGLSTNGTFVNGQRIGGRQRLRDGDRIRVGRTLIAYRDCGAGRHDTTVVSRERADVVKLSDTQRRVLVALCRPFRDGAAFAVPATNHQIAAEVFLGVDAVKMHLRTLFARFELGDLPQNQKRATLAEHALQLGVVTTRDLNESPGHT